MHVSVSPLAFICFWLSFWCVAKAKTKWHTVHCHLLVWNRCATVIFVEWSRVERINRENILMKVTLFNYFSNISFKISPSPFYYILFLFFLHSPSQIRWGRDECGLLVQISVFGRPAEQRWSFCVSEPVSQLDVSQLWLDQMVLLHVSLTFPQ